MKSGGDQEFESLTMPHVHALFQTALQLTENRAAAAELVHEVYACAWKSFRLGDHPADWRLRLFKILMERARRRPGKPKHGTPSSLPTDDVTAALARLPPALREMVLLIDGQEFSYDETAAILDLCGEAIAKGIALGREHLMKGLTEMPVSRAQEYFAEHSKNAG